MPRSGSSQSNAEGSRRSSGEAAVSSAALEIEPSQVVSIFRTLDKAVRDNALIVREGPRDKEFHLQDWFSSQLADAGITHESAGRNSYPDFLLVDTHEGFEIKGLAYPGRHANLDANSRVPRGKHKGMTIYYVFGRYPKKPQTDEYPVKDLVVCHGDFFNVDHDYEHRNDHFVGFGSFGDIKVRDRKMYIMPTPYALLDGIVDRVTLILPSEMTVDLQSLKVVGNITRSEIEEKIVAYEFDLATNALTTRTSQNPNEDREHSFTAYRSIDGNDDPVTLREPS